MFGGIMNEETQNMVFASGHYLSKYFPNDFKKMTDEELLEFVKNNTWSPFESLDPVDILGFINQMAQSITKNYNQKQEEN
jgi:hypothetical protein